MKMSKEQSRIAASALRQAIDAEEAQLTAFDEIDNTSGPAIACRWNLVQYRGLLRRIEKYLARAEALAS